MSTAATAEMQKGEALKLELRRVIRASRQRVFAAWTNPQEVRRWLAPGAMSVAEVEVDLRVGGAYRIVMQGSVEGKPEDSGRRVSASGIYQEIIPDQLIRFTWNPEYRPDEHTEITVRLREVEGGTELLLTQVGFATVESRDGHSHGWSSCFGKLEDAVGQ